MTATTHDKIVHSAVAIKFVQNMDEFIYLSCITPSRQAEHRRWRSLSPCFFKFFLLAVFDLSLLLCFILSLSRAQLGTTF
jgi:uncharacterized membrane protein